MISFKAKLITHFSLHGRCCVQFTTIIAASFESCLCIFLDTPDSDLPAALWLLLHVHFKAPSFREALARRTLWTAMIASLAASLLFLQTEMFVQILIKRWASLCCLFPLDSPLRLNASKWSYLFFTALFFLSCENQCNIPHCCYKSLLIFVLFWGIACNNCWWSGKTISQALYVRYLLNTIMENQCYFRVIIVWIWG